MSNGSSHLSHKPEFNSRPVCLLWSDEQLTLNCRLRFNKRALRTGPAKADGRTYAELICEGIKRHWSGRYELGDPEHPDLLTVTVVIQIVRNKPAVPVKIRRLLVMPAHVISPFYRRLWGILRTGQLESLGHNWSPCQPGMIIMPPYENADQVGRIAAHEMGHIFGIGDAYAAIYRFYAAAPGTQNYMMHSNRQVQPHEIRMLLRAHSSGRMQFFPKRWNARVFRAGLSRDIRQTVRRIRHNLRHRFCKSI